MSTLLSLEIYVYILFFHSIRIAQGYTNVRDVLRAFLSDFKSVTLETKQKWATQGSKFASLARAGMSDMYLSFHFNLMAC